MKAKYDSTCSRCGGNIVKGETELTLWKDGPKHRGGFRWVHTGCEIDVEHVRGWLSKSSSDPGPGWREFAEKGVVTNGAPMKAEVDVKKLAAELEDKIRSEVDALLEEKLQGVTQRFEIFDHVTGEVRELGDDLFHEAFQEILELAACRFPIFLPGPTGSGKSHVCRQVADALGLEFSSVSCTMGMSEGQLTGRLVPAAPTAAEIALAHRELVELGMDDTTAATVAAGCASGNFRFQMTEFIRRYEEGGVFLLDEIDAADPNILLVFNSAVANGHLPLPNRTDNPVAKRHPDFILIAAANTIGKGADRIYSGRNQLDAATLDRFSMSTVPMDYDRKLEAALAGSICGDVEHQDILHWFWNIRDAARECRVEQSVSTRSIEKACQLRRATGATLERVQELFFRLWDDRDKNKVLAA